MQEDLSCNPLAGSNSKEKPVQSAEDAIFNMKLSTLQKEDHQYLSQKSLKRPHIKFYSGYSSFNHDISLKHSSKESNLEASIMQGTRFIRNPHEQQFQEDIDHSIRFGEQQKQTRIEVTKNNCAAGQAMMMQGEAECKLEEPNYKKRVCQSFSINRIYASINLESREAMKRKITRGMYSIASRKYQPIIDSREIFDDEELENNVLGPDQCRLWRNLMNKYFLRSNKYTKNKKKTLLKSEGRLKSDQTFEFEEVQKKKRGPKGKRKQANEYEVMIKKQEEEEEQMYQPISENVNGNTRGILTRKKSLSVLKKEQEQLSRAMIELKPQRYRQLQYN